MTKPQVQLVREGIEQLRAVDNPENDRQAQAIEWLLQASLERADEQAPTGDEPPQDEWPNLVPLDGDPDAVQLKLPSDVRDVVSLLRPNDLSPSYSRAIQTIEILARRDAARGRELDRMRSLVLGVTSGEARQGLEAEIRLLNQRLAAATAEIAEQREQFNEQAVEFGERCRKLDERRRRSADRAQSAYHAWMSVCVRLENQAEVIRALKDELARFQGGEG